MLQLTEWNPLEETSVLNSCSALYTKTNLKYQEQYLADTSFKNLSKRIEHDGLIIAELIISIAESTTGPQTLNAWGLPLVFLENTNAPCSLKKEANRLLLKEFKSLLEHYQAAKISLTDYLVKNTPNTLSLHLLSKGATNRTRFLQNINLKGSEAELKSNLRKSYKPLINKGLRELEPSILDHTNISEDIIEEFRLLHIQVSGRVTRSKESWEAQLQAIKNNEAFIVTIRQAGVLVGASYFITNSLSCYYGVGAYRRDLYPLPISHTSLWLAILHAKSTGCLRFEIGEAFFPEGSFPVSDKEVSIAKFKRGFGGYTQAELLLTLEPGGQTIA